jgi:hypothetical protein
MKEEHGDVLDEFESVVRDLDALSNELHMVSDHAVQLDANFSKYGYSAHLRMFYPYTASYTLRIREDKHPISWPSFSY